MPRLPQPQGERPVTFFLLRARKWVLKNTLPGPAAKSDEKCLPSIHRFAPFSPLSGRPARAEEVKLLVSYLEARTDRPEAACQQVVWALLTSAEFRFNH